MNYRILNDLITYNFKTNVIIAPRNIPPVSDFSIIQKTFDLYCQFFFKIFRLGQNIFSPVLCISGKTYSEDDIHFSRKGNSNFSFTLVNFYRVIYNFCTEGSKPLPNIREKSTIYVQNTSTVVESSVLNAIKTCITSHHKLDMIVRE